MILIGVLAIIAMLIYGWLSRKQYNRSVDRHNRMVDKQEELLQLLKDKNENTKDDN